MIRYKTINFLVSSISFIAIYFVIITWGRWGVGIYHCFMAPLTAAVGLKRNSDISLPRG